MDNPIRYPEQPEPQPLHSPMVFVKEPIAWEYKRLDRHLDKGGAPTAEELSELGADGWELAGILTAGESTCFYFKRPK